MTTTPAINATTVTSTGSSSTTSTSTTCSTIPSETAGPYPGDGTNSNGSGIANALLLSGIVRRQRRSAHQAKPAAAINQLPVTPGNGAPDAGGKIEIFLRGSRG